MKLIVTEEDLILDTNEGTYTMKRAFEEDEWHVINEFVDLNFITDDEGYSAHLYFVNDGMTMTDFAIPLEIELN